jgi:multidrug efflux pump
MPISRFFIQRPIFAWVIAIAIMLAGLAAITTLPVAQYPDIAPPQINVSAVYPGASAETVESSVVQVLEQQVTGLDGLLYFSSSATSAGSARITITFAKGTNPDIAQVQVQNRVQQAVARLPQQVQQQGLTVTKANADFLLIVGLGDASNRGDDAAIGDYLVNQFQDDIARIPGVGQTQVIGAQYAMRIWLDPTKLASYGLMPSDVRAALMAQNAEISAGQIGEQPSLPGQRLNAVVKAKSRFNNPDQFRRIVVKTSTDGSVVRLSDVARVELGQEDYSMVAGMNGHPASGMAVMLAPGADALKTARAVKARVDELSRKMPAGYTIAYPRDSTDFIKRSVREVVQTLVIAVLLVVAVMYIFLQSWRATLVPAIAVPVVLLGTFGVLAVFGYSINTLTLFGMVLAIGLLVDDAIVVVENVERLMAEEGLGPREATIKSMGEIGSALIGIAVVLSAVMIPMAFFGGSTGVIYRQFSVTMVTAMLLSVLVALVLSPAICANLLKPSERGPQTRGILAKFNRNVAEITEHYIGLVRGVLGRRWLFLAIYAVIVGVLALLFLRLPTSFLPVEDQGQVMVQFELPAGATIDRTEAVRQRINQHFLRDETRNMNVIMTIAGSSPTGGGQSAGQGFATLAPFDQRKGHAGSAEAISQRAMQAFRNIRDARVFVLIPPAIMGLGQSNGFEFELLNTTGASREDFIAIRDRLIAAANADPKLAQVRSGVLQDAPQLRIDIDETKLAVLGLSEADVTDTLSAAWGSAYVNDFVDRGRIKRVYMQGDAPFRALPSDLDRWFVRGRNGAMTPFSAFATSHWESGPNSATRFNGRSSYEVQGQAAPGVSSGDAMKEMIALQRRVAPGMSYAWSGLSFQEEQSSGQASLLYAVSVLVVFLSLAALYESWSVPLAILLVLPLGVVGAVLAVTIRGLDNNIFFQVGLLTTIGLAAKNAILIVEFAEAARRQGQDIVAATMDAARIRLRPILMTSISFMAGVVPLALASGAGAQSRIAIGTAVLGGILTATVLAIFYVPLFFVAVAQIFHRPAAPPSAPETA